MKISKTKEFTHKRIKSTKGFTIVEMVIVVTIIAILSALLIPEVMSQRKLAKGMACGDALRTIQAAKNKFHADYPDITTLSSVSQLYPYLPGGTFPVDPWGVGFNTNSILDLTTMATHPYNGIPGYEPSGTNLMQNGYNDCYQLNNN
jgi:prepilin-type N-terminal cleavage/methylation domain-containing protein